MLLIMRTSKADTAARRTMSRLHTCSPSPIAIFELNCLLPHRSTSPTHVPSAAWRQPAVFTSQPSQPPGTARWRVAADPAGASAVVPSAAWRQPAVFVAQHSTPPGTARWRVAADGEPHAGALRLMVNRTLARCGDSCWRVGGRSISRLAPACGFHSTAPHATGNRTPPGPARWREAVIPAGASEVVPSAAWRQPAVFVASHNTPTGEPHAGALRLMGNRTRARGG